jgi:hypothetical protein
MHADAAPRRVVDDLDRHSSKGPGAGRSIGVHARTPSCHAHGQSSDPDMGTGVPGGTCRAQKNIIRRSYQQQCLASGLI